MSKVTIPQGYHAPLSVYELQRAIEFIKSNFQTNLSNALNLRRVSAPLFVEEASGLNDNLNGYERPVSFDIPDVGAEAQVVHSLAKWKRLALKRYQFNVGKGLFTDMNAIRRDEEVDNLHSVYVDQWDWEKVIAREDRTVDYLKRTVRDIVGAVCETNDALEAAKTAERFMVGFDANQNNLDATHILASSHKNHDDVIDRFFADFVAGTFHGGENVVNSYANDGLKFTYQEGLEVPDDIASVMEAVKANLASGELVPPSSEEELAGWNQTLS